MGLQTLGKKDHSWGYEIVWASNDRYSGKMLVFERAGAKTGMLLHKDRAKSWFVSEGRFKLIFIDTKTGKMTEAVVEQGKTVDLGPLSPHHLESLEPNSVIIEVGTPDDTDDVIRLSPGDEHAAPEQPT